LSDLGRCQSRFLNRHSGGRARRRWKAWSFGYVEADRDEFWTLERSKYRWRTSSRRCQVAYAVVIQVKLDPNSDLEHRHAILNDYVIPEAKALPGF